jgi:hypothetical protein
MTNLTNYWPAWLAIVLATLVALNQAISESQKFANLLGGWARKMHARAKIRHRMDIEEFNDAVRDAVADERKRWEEDEASSINILERRLRHVSDMALAQQEEISELSWSRRCNGAYAEYESYWHQKLRVLILKANRNGGSIPIEELPENVPFHEFEQMCRERGNFNWQKWGII